MPLSWPLGSLRVGALALRDPQVPGGPPVRFGGCLCNRGENEDVSLSCCQNLGLGEVNLDQPVRVGRAAALKWALPVERTKKGFYYLLLFKIGSAYASEN